MLLPVRFPVTEELLLLDEDTRPSRLELRVVEPFTAELLRLLLVRPELTLLLLLRAELLLLEERA